MSQIRRLIDMEKDVTALSEDVAMMPEWMKRIVKPMINNKV